VQPSVPHAAQGWPHPPLEPAAPTEVARSSAHVQRGSEGPSHNIL